MIILGLIVFLFMIGIPCFLIFKFFQWIFSGLGFGSSPEATEKKIVRTKIEYYETCPSCGAGRVEGKDECPYCGRSMIKSKEIIEEKDLDKPLQQSRHISLRKRSQHLHPCKRDQRARLPFRRPQTIRRRSQSFQSFQRLQAPFLLCVLLRFVLCIQLRLRFQLCMRLRMCFLRPRRLLREGIL